jgi:hypothetical protein
MRAKVGESLFGFFHGQGYKRDWCTALGHHMNQTKTAMHKANKKKVFVLAFTGLTSK